MSPEPIYCEHKPSPAKLDVLGAYDWPIWKKEVFDDGEVWVAAHP